MINVDENGSIIQHSMESIYPAFEKLIFIVNSSDVYNFSIDQFLKRNFGDDVVVHVLDHETRGAVETVLSVKKHLNKNDSIFVWCSDVRCSEIDPNYILTNLDGALYTFKSNNPAYSYCQIDEKGFVTKVEEKKVISSNANVGGYYFKTWDIFEIAAKKLMDNNDTINNEFYISKVYNYMIKKGMKVKTCQVDSIYIFGTPNEFDFYRNHILNKFGKENSVVALSSDHSGFKTKESCKKILDKMKIKWVDYGCYSDKPTDYADWSAVAVKALEDGDCTHLILSCATGQGQNLLVNKSKKILNGLIWNEEMARMSIEHNCCNSWSIPERFVDEELLRKMLNVLKNSSFGGGRHQARIMKVLGAT